MATIEEKIKGLPPDLQQEVQDFVDFLMEKHRPQGKVELKLDWRGGLRDLRDQYTSVELQHKIRDMWCDESTSSATIPPSASIPISIAPTFSAGPPGDILNA